MARWTNVPDKGAHVQEFNQMKAIWNGEVIAESDDAVVIIRIITTL